MLNLVDCTLTQVALNRGMLEINPLWRDHVWFKMLPAAYISVRIGRHGFIMTVLVVGMSAIVVWNGAMLWLCR